jgi:hypothetical protein
MVDIPSSAGIVNLPYIARPIKWINWCRIDNRVDARARYDYGCAKRIRLRIGVLLLPSYRAETQFLFEENMERPCFLVVYNDFSHSISTRKLVIESAKFNVITAYSAERQLQRQTLSTSQCHCTFSIAPLSDGGLHQLAAACERASWSEKLAIVCLSCESTSSAMVITSVSTRDKSKALRLVRRVLKMQT